MFCFQMIPDAITYARGPNLRLQRQGLGNVQQFVENVVAIRNRHLLSQYYAL